jgi:hypothetical protein
MEKYTILLSRESEIPLKLATEIGRILDRSEAEVSRGLRDHPWVLLEEVPAVHLDSVFDLLTAEGVPAKAVPGVHMPALPPALRVRVADPLPNAFFLQVAEPPSPAALPWDRTKVVNAGRVILTPKEAGRVYAAWRGPSAGGLETPGSAPMGGKREAPEPFLLDLVATGEELLRLRIDAGNFNYDYLKDRMRPTSRENFRHLIEDIRQRAPNARFTRTALSFLAGEPVASHRFRSLKAFNAMSLWTLQAILEQESEDT